MLFGLGLLSIIFIRLSLLDFPLERDEGEYAYMGQLIRKAIPPYELGYNMKLPGTYYMYALIMWLFGETTNGIHAGLLLCNTITIVLIFVIARELVSEQVAVMASLLYGWMAASASVLGFAGHATHFVTLMAMAGTLSIQLAIKRTNALLFVLSGMLFSLSYIMKQHGVFFIVMGQAIIIWCNEKRDLKSILNASLWFIVGVVFCVLILHFAMYSFGVWERFWFWTVTYASNYGSQLSVPGALYKFLLGIWYVTRSFFLAWILSLVGAIFLLKAKESTITAKKRLFVIIFTIFSFLTVVPGFYFRPHYFITFLPAISILAAIGSRGLFTSIKRERAITSLSYLSILVAIVVGIFIERNYFLFEKSPHALSHSIYSKINAFPETQKAAEFVKANTNIHDKVFVLGSEPQIYFFSDRLSATGYLYMFPFVENHPHSNQMQNEMIKEVESANPEMLVYVHTAGSWSNKIETLPYLVSWFEKYSTSGFVEVAVIDIVSGENQIIKLGDDIKNYVPVSNNFIKIFKRRFPC